MESDLRKILELNPKKNIAVLSFFKNYQIEDYHKEGSSFLIFGKSDHMWAHIVSSSKRELSILLDKYSTKTKYYFSVEDWMIPEILKYGTVDWTIITNRYTLDENICPKPPGIEVIPLDKTYASYIYSYSEYRDYISIDYAAERLNNDISAGIIINDRLVAWGFTHDDGALGFLHVLDEYRGKGYGTSILLGLIKSRRETKRPVFGNVVPDNFASVKLILNIGFEFDRRTSWIKLI